jgi:hypothetical protein
MILISWCCFARRVHSVVPIVVTEMVLGFLSLRDGSETCCVFLTTGGQFAGAWVPYGAGPLPARSHSHARLLPAGPRLFLPGPSGPERIVPRAYTAQVGMGAASARIPTAHRSHPWAPAVIILDLEEILGMLRCQPRLEALGCRWLSSLSAHREVEWWIHSTAEVSDPAAECGKIGRAQGWSVSIGTA